MQQLIAVVFLFSLCFSVTTLKGQTSSCGTDMVQTLLYQQYTSLAKQEQLVNRKIYDYVIQSATVRSGSTITIPVVFHIIHQNGPENIPDSILIREIDILNLRFQNAAPYFDTAGSDMEIQFCLATTDPWGNATTGITRDTSVYTDVHLNTGSLINEDIMMKNVNRWNPYNYLNIWIVRSVWGTNSPYASLPWSLGAPNDGIVFSYGSLGGNSLVLTHEVGHYLGLYHTFQNLSPCLNLNCLLDGDYVCDTPPDTVSSNCYVNSCSSEMNDTSGFNPFLTDQLDFPSYMGMCWKAFSNGQKERMQASLSQIRTALTTSFGCGSSPVGLPPVAAYSHTSPGCGQEQFISQTAGALYTEWDFNSDGYIEATGDSVVYQYPVSGTYTVTLRVFNNGGADSIQFTVQTVSPPFDNYPLMDITQTNFNFTYGEFACFGKTIYAFAAPGLHNILWSTGDTTQVISFVADTTFNLWVQGIDSTGFLWTMCNGGVNLMVTDPLPVPQIIVLPNDTVCAGDSISFVAVLNDGLTVSGWRRDNQQINSTDTLYSWFPPAGTHTLTVTALDSLYCPVKSDTLFFYSDIQVNPYTPVINGLTLEGAGGIWHNQWYFNNAPIPGATGTYYTVSQPGCYRVYTWMNFPGCGTMSDSVCFVTVNNQELIPVEDLSVYTVNGLLHISAVNTVGNGLRVELYSITGALCSVKEFSVFAGNATIPLTELAGSIYMVRIITPAETRIFKGFNVD